MDIIPVLDLKDGLVVHARGGGRDRYKPIETALSAGSAPANVLAGLRAVVPVRQVYIADLDAIEGRGDHAEIIAALAEANPDIAFWVDAGLAAAAVPGWQAEGGGIAVIGSESQSIAVPLPPGSVLSLDFRGDRFLGPAALLYDASLWPDNVIVMTLARVGMAAGPDTERLAGVLARAGTRRIYAAGGVRDTEDLRHLRDLGVAGALVATALHNGKITNDTLRGL